MINYDDFQYDSCVLRGICSVNPRISSLQRVLVVFLKVASFYALKLYDLGVIKKDLKGLILNTISILVSNPDFAESDFKSIIETFNQVIPSAIDEYKKISEDKGTQFESLKTELDFSEKTDVIKFIREGEKIYLNEIDSIPQAHRDFYKILFVIAKGICTNILDLESLGIDIKSGYYTILELLNLLNYPQYSLDEIKNEIFKVAEMDYNLSLTLREAWSERYGKQHITEVSSSTVQGKAILVAGSNIKELEDILEALKNEDIDIYTHDEMMIAHIFPKFQKYKHLKGQYGQGIENCILDFSTFPGPIILTRHSLYNVEHLYRGLLYTTDFAFSKGVIQIQNRDFTPLIAAAEKSRGFKTGKNCETVMLGYDSEFITDAVYKKLDEENYSKIFVIGQGGYSFEQQTYFEKLLKKTPEDVLIISLGHSTDRQNALYFNTCFDDIVIVKIIEKLKTLTDLELVIFFPSCSRHTIAQMITLKNKYNLIMYIGTCTPLSLNPNLFYTLESQFGIKSTTSVKTDLEEIFKNLK